MSKPAALAPPLTPLNNDHWISFLFKKGEKNTHGVLVKSIQYFLGNDETENPVGKM